MSRAVIYSGKLPTKGKIVLPDDADLKTLRLSLNLIVGDEIIDASRLGYAVDLDDDGKVIVTSSKKKALSNSHACKIVAEWGAKSKKGK